MDNETIIFHHPTNFQFLSVCHYITSFGLFFYNRNLIPLENRNHSTAVLNTYFEYIQKWENPNEGKLNLLQRVLKGSDLYGGGENETLDMRYVDETYQYIISNALFSHYGNIHGYLAGIINQADNITYSALKETVYQEFSMFYTSRDFCSSRNEHIQLTQLTVDKVFLENVWSMFPETEENMNILDVNYIYAMTGLKITNSVNGDITNKTFDSYILLARAIEFQTLNDAQYQIALELFTTPALFYYAYNEKEKYREDTLVMIKTDGFWQQVYRKFFLFLNLKVRNSMKEDIRKSLHFQLEEQYKQIENRTHMATRILKGVCHFKTDDDVPGFYVSFYKTAEWLLRIFIPGRCKNLPDLEDTYREQFGSIRKTFNEIEQNSLEQVLTDGNLIQKMNSNTTVEFAKVPSNQMHCMYCAPWPRKMNQDIYLLFAIVENKRKEFYALRQVNNTLSLLTCSGNEREFARAVARDPSLKMETLFIAEYLKHRGEDYKSFIKRVADIKTDQFIKGLSAYYRNPTKGEIVINVLKSLVPFYTCVENIKSGNQGEAALSCSLDVLSLLPIAGVVEKYSSIMWTSLITEIGQQTLLSATKVSLITKLTITTTLNQIYSRIFRTLTEKILTKGLLKDLTIASLRTLDPGFELTYHFFRFSNNMLGKLVQKLSSKLINSPKIMNLLPSINFASKIINIKNEKFITDRTGLLASVLNDKMKEFKIIRYNYPGGSNYFGPKCVSSFGRTAELRTIEGNLFQVPVVAVKSPKGSIITYREYQPKTGKISPAILEMGEDDILRRMKPEGRDSTHPNYNKYWENEVTWKDGIYETEMKLNEEGVYCNTRRFKRTGKTNLNENFGDNFELCIVPLPLDVNPGTSRAAERARGSSDDIPGTSRSTVPLNVVPIHQQDIQKTINLLEKFKEKGLVGIKDDMKELTTFRRIVNSLDTYQTMKIVRKPPSELWFSQTLTRPSIVNDLKNLKGKDFYFNDITLVTATDPSDIIPKKIPRYSLKTEVRYHMKIDSQYGLLDLAELDGNNFQNQYILFPEVNFFVTDTNFFNGKEILVVELQKKAISKAEWLKIREKKKMIIDSREIVLSERSESIEKAALFISQNTPLHRFSRMENTLKKYILKIDDSVSSQIPTYDLLARDIYSGSISGQIPGKYSEWKIINDRYVDDVLFHKTLPQIDNVELAKHKIDRIYNGIYEQWVEPVFEIYQRRQLIRESLRFEDYYVIYSFLSHNLLSDIYAPGRVAAAIRRLALRQCLEEPNKTPFSIYFAANLPEEEFRRIIRLKTGEDYRFPVLQQFHSNRESELKYLQFKLPSETFVLYELRVTNKAGIADLSSIITDPRVEYYVPEESKLTILERSMEKIDGKDVFVMKLHNDQWTTEQRMVKLANKLSEILSRGGHFYTEL